MATIWDPTKDEQQKQSMGAGAPPPTPTGTSGTGTQGTSGAAKPTGSGQFTNLQSYIRANENTDAGKKVGSGVLGVADNAMKTASTEVGKLTSMTPGSGPAQMDSADEAFLSTKQAAQGFDYSNKKDAQGYKSWADQQAEIARQNLDRFNNIFSKYGQGPGSYSGPSKDDVSKKGASAMSDVSAAQQANQVLRGDNQAGRSSLLQTQYGNTGDYSRGQNKLDSFLLERNFGSQFDPRFQQQDSALKAQSQKAADLTAQRQEQIGQTQDAYTAAQERWRTLLNNAQAATSQELNSAQAAQAEAAQAIAAMPVDKPFDPVDMTPTSDNGFTFNPTGMRYTQSGDMIAADGSIISKNDPRYIPPA